MLGTGPASAATGTPLPTAQAKPSALSAKTSWSANRLDNAAPVDAAAIPAAARYGISAQRTAAHRPPPPGMPESEHFLGHKLVGTVFFDGQSFGGPRYRDKRYSKNTKTAASDLDLAFAQVHANSRGKEEDVTAGSGLHAHQQLPPSWPRPPDQTDAGVERRHRRHGPPHTTRDSSAAPPPADQPLPYWADLRRGKRREPWISPAEVAVDQGQGRSHPGGHNRLLLQSRARP